ncbi:hypothetical protein IE53DRAFT_370846 [Violaceomyces palustris]|uniref:Uncharacterized protein n=1 Tax=Violaceomyces palustris TaxID=1673888 RepID=A0ACD0NQS8_9BASI|nr:hypothetical protein IE53DRAFT_370846 [Violaceomyces palustris]
MIITSSLVNDKGETFPLQRRHHYDRGIFHESYSDLIGKLSREWHLKFPVQIEALELVPFKLIIDDQDSFKTWRHHPERHEGRTGLYETTSTYTINIHTVHPQSKFMKAKEPEAEHVLPPWFPTTQRDKSSAPDPLSQVFTKSPVVAHLESNVRQVLGSIAPTMDSISSSFQDLALEIRDLASEIKHSRLEASRTSSSSEPAVKSETSQSPSDQGSNEGGIVGVIGLASRLLSEAHATLSSQLEGIHLTSSAQDQGQADSSSNEERLETASEGPAPGTEQEAARKVNRNPESAKSMPVAQEEQLVVPNCQNQAPEEVESVNAALATGWSRQLAMMRGEPWPPVHPEEAISSPGKSKGESVQDSGSEADIKLESGSQTEEESRKESNDSLPKSVTEEIQTTDQRLEDAFEQMLTQIRGRTQQPLYNPAPSMRPNEGHHAAAGSHQCRARSNVQPGAQESGGPVSNIEDLGRHIAGKVIERTDTLLSIAFENMLKQVRGQGAASFEGQRQQGRMEDFRRGS